MGNLFCWRRTVMDETALAGKVILVTGSTSGLGLHAAKAFYRMGATLILTCRDHVRGRQAIEALSEKSDKTDGRIHLFELDLCDYRSILQFTRDVKEVFEKLDVLVCNAGVMGLAFELSYDGVERHLATNHLGHFILVNQLLPLLAVPEEARILVITSGLYKGADEIPPSKQLMGELIWDYDPKTAYAVSKLANCLYTRELARRLAERYPSVRAFAIRPGFVRGTELGRETHWLLRKLAAPIIWLFSRNLDQGIEGYLRCSMDPIEKLHSGGLYFDGQEEQYLPTVTTESAEKFWRQTEEMEELIAKRRRNLPDADQILAAEGRNRLAI